MRPIITRMNADQKSASIRVHVRLSLRVNVHWSRQQRERIVNVERLPHIKRLAGLDSNQRSEIPHPKLNLLQKSALADSSRRLFRSSIVKLRSVSFDRTHLLINEIRHVDYKRRNDATREKRVHDRRHGNRS